MLIICYVLYITHLLGPRSPTSVATVLSSFYILGIGLMMAAKQQPKHVADVLNDKVVL